MIVFAQQAKHRSWGLLQIRAPVVGWTMGRSGPMALHWHSHGWPGSAVCTMLHVTVMCHRQGKVDGHCPLVSVYM